jgi:flavin-dependent dehydrogenase
MDKKTIVVLGGGPGGSTAAALLAEKGYTVKLIEKETHPRFHIGESLLPANIPLLDRLGVHEAVRKVSMEKWGAEFNSPTHNATERIEFKDAINCLSPHAYQVRRSEFDEILFRNAAKQGVLCEENCLAESADFSGPQVAITLKKGSGEREVISADYVVDATGRDTFLSSRLKLKQKNPKHASVAIYGHFTNATRLPGKREGDVSIFWFAHGWFWFIPLADGTTSVGAVCWPYYLAQREGSLNDFFKQTIQLNAELAGRLTHAQMTHDATATGNYSYSSSQSTGDRYLLVGDAYAFIDPVFSSGVFLAMQSGEKAAETVHTVLQQPRQAATALRRYEAFMRHGPSEFSWFIYRVTNPTMRDLFMAPRNFLGAKMAVITVLAGDVYQNWRMRAPLAVFKAVYYIASAINWRRTQMAIKQRALNIREVAT